MSYTSHTDVVGRVFWEKSIQLPLLGRRGVSQPKFERLRLGGGFKDFLCSPLFGEDSHFDEHIFQMG